jgi:disulfide bond formation protein DsbB
VTLNPSRWSFRNQCFAGFAACVALVGFAIFSQFQWGLAPCPLCIFQRIAFAALALVPVLVGIGIATRHVWLTHLPADQVPACGPPLSVMMEANPLNDVIRQVLTGSGECAKVDWTFLGLSMPAWSLLWFVLLGLLVLSAAFRRR